MNNWIEWMNDRLNGSTPSLSDIKKEVTTHTVPSSIERLNGRTPSLSNLTTETPNWTVTPSIDRLNGGTQSLSDIQLEVTPKTITPSKIISAIENAWIRYEWDRIIIRGWNITIWSVTYKKLTGAGEKGPVYQVGTSVGWKDYIRLRDREKSEMWIEYGKYDSGGKYILCWKLENGAILKWEAYRIDLTNGDLYSWTFDNNSNMVWTVQYGVIRGWTIKEWGVDQYDWHIKNGKKEWSWKYISANWWWTFDWTRENDKMKSWKLEMANWDKYEWDLVTINEHSLWTRDIVKKILEWNLEDDEIIQLHERLQMDNGEIGGTAYYKEANSKYECTITSWKITELSDNADFITMFGDNKEDEHWDAKRWDIVFEAGINNNSYILHSWNQKTERKLSWWYWIRWW